MSPINENAASLRLRALVVGSMYSVVPEMRAAFPICYSLYVLSSLIIVTDF